ncbi:MAG: sigma-54 interaction domain-containing protein [Pirellulaceae bacterium]
MRVLISWIGRSDLIAAAKNRPADDPGPILRLLRQERFDEVHLLNDVQSSDARRGEASAEDYKAWLTNTTRLSGNTVHLHTVGENLRNRYDLAYEYTRDELAKIRDEHRLEPARFALLLSPGYPAALVGLIIAQQTLLDPDTELFETSREKGVERVTLPFFQSVDVVPALQRRWQQHLQPAIHPAFDEIIGQSKAMLLAKQMSQHVAPYDRTSVILRGETGTGKELFARAIHKASPRRKKPLVPVNCAAIPSELLESELFGHVKGAFTTAISDRRGKVVSAEGGTLFLDEIGDMALDLQAKLLRFLQERKFYPVGSDREESADVRILAATHRDLERAVEAGRFRADLYYRLNGVSLYLPPLCERGRDVHTLAQHFLKHWTELNGKGKSLTDGALASLARYPWRGNVRELQNAVGRLAIFSPEDAVTPDDVELWLGPPAAPTAVPLSQLPPDAFACRLVATIDELLSRFRQEDRLPWSLPTSADLFEQVLDPLVTGRALRAAQADRKKAGELIRASKVDLTQGKPDKRRADRYEAELKPRISEEIVAQLRGKHQ